MNSNGKKLVFLIKYLVVGVTVYLVSWLAIVGEWSGGRSEEAGERLAPTIRTIVAYSEGKRAEMERPNPVSCDKLPTLPRVPFVNRTWSSGVRWDGWSSWQPVPNAPVMLYAAYYDDRLPQHYVRLLAQIPGRFYPTENQLYCQTRLLDQPPHLSEPSVEVVAAKPLEIWYRNWDTIRPQVKTALLLSCPLSEPLYGPSVVSVVTETCEDPLNAFLITPYAKEPTSNLRNYTICVKDMNFKKDISTRLIEWIETNKLLGINKIDMYIDKLHYKTEKVLEHYRRKGYVRLFHVPINHARDTELWEKRRDHVVTYNDCLYRNLKESRFIIPLDVDEIILPKIADNLDELIERLRVSGWDLNTSSAALIRNTFFFDKIQKQYKCDNDSMSDGIIINWSKKIYPKKASISSIDENIKTTYRNRCKTELEEPVLVKHVMRSQVVSPNGMYSKSIMVTKNVLIAFNHYPLFGIQEPRAHWFAPFHEVQLNHYKENCNSTNVPECRIYQRKIMKDCSALKLWNPLLKAIAATSPC